MTVGVFVKSKCAREDLDAMDEAVAEAKTAGVSEAVAYMVDASILKDRGEKQLEAQNMLTQALASLSKSKMRGDECILRLLFSSPVFVPKCGDTDI